MTLLESLELISSSDVIKMMMQATDTERDALDAVTARFFKGLGDVNWLKILEFLRHGEKAAGEIVEYLGLPQNQVSMHLRCLEVVRLCQHPTRRPLCAIQHGR